MLQLIAIPEFLEVSVSEVSVNAEPYPWLPYGHLCLFPFLSE